MSEAGLSAARRSVAAVLARLRDTRPDHDPASMRLGAGLVRSSDERLRSLLPAAPLPAAVLVGIVDHPLEPSLLLTVRASHLRHHAGQIAFPGGRIEAGDLDPAAAALREAQEEIGLAASAVRVHGYLPDHLVLTGYRVTPVIASIEPGFALNFDREEVQDVFELPWSHLLDPANHHDSQRSFAGTQVAVRDIHFGTHRIWGATAGILLALVALTRQGSAV